MVDPRSLQTRGVFRRTCQRGSLEDGRAQTGVLGQGVRQLHRSGRGMKGGAVTSQDVVAEIAGGIAPDRKPDPGRQLYFTTSAVAQAQLT